MLSASDIPQYAFSFRTHSEPFRFQGHTNVFVLRIQRVASLALRRVVHVKSSWTTNGDRWKYSIQRFASTALCVRCIRRFASLALRCVAACYSSIAMYVYRFRTWVLSSRTCGDFPRYRGSCGENSARNGVPKTRISAKLFCVSCSIFEPGLIWKVPGPRSCCERFFRLARVASQANRRRRRAAHAAWSWTRLYIM